MLVCSVWARGVFWTRLTGGRWFFGRRLERSSSLSCSRSVGFCCLILTPPPPPPPQPDTLIRLKHICCCSAHTHKCLYNLYPYPLDHRENQSHSHKHTHSPGNLKTSYTALLRIPLNLIPFYYVIISLNLNYSSASKYIFFQFPSAIIIYTAFIFI